MDEDRFVKITPNLFEAKIYDDEWVLVRLQRNDRGYDSKWLEKKKFVEIWNFANANGRVSRVVDSPGTDLVTQF